MTTEKVSFKCDQCDFVSNRQANDEFIENYLMTGKISPEITGTLDINELKKVLQFVLSPHCTMGQIGL